MANNGEHNVPVIIVQPQVSVAVRAVAARRPAQTRQQSQQQRQPRPQAGPETRQQQPSRPNAGTSTSSSSKRYGPCFRCGRRHDPNTCPARSWQCYKCNRKGHVKSLCPSVHQNVIYEEGAESETDQTQLSVEEELDNILSLRTIPNL